jgi:uncharacterized protein
MPDFEDDNSTLSLQPDDISSSELPSPTSSSPNTDSHKEETGLERFEGFIMEEKVEADIEHQHTIGLNGGNDGVYEPTSSVYHSDRDGDTNELEEDLDCSQRPSYARKLSRRLSDHLDHSCSSIAQQLPNTSQGWLVLASALATATVGYELYLQKRLTGPPLVFGQCHADGLQAVHDRLTRTPQSILRRDIQPSLFVGTRAVAASTASYMLRGPSATPHHVRFREVLTMPLDGAEIAVDWELTPLTSTTSSSSNSYQPTMTDAERIAVVKTGPIQQPIVIILHGLNNHSRFGYIQSLQRTCTDRGWLALGLNFRGCGGVRLATPRGYNGAYTGDLRYVIHTLSGRLAKNVPIFLVGNSLGANVVAKYLGEEGLSNTLPDCVAGGITLGNPSRLNSKAVDRKWTTVLSLGCQKFLLEHILTFGVKSNTPLRQAVRKAMTTRTLASFDEAMAPFAIRNDAVYPFATQVGYRDGAHYWEDGSSYKLIPFISVPTLQVVAADDFLVFHPFRSRLGFALANPKVMIVETKCGGHLGWQESPPNGFQWGAGSSWANVVTADFIQAILDTRKELDNIDTAHDSNALFSKRDAMQEVARLRSRL